MNNQSPEMIEIAQEMRAVCKRLDDASRVMHKYARTKAEKERDYRKALAQEMIKLRAEGLPATLIGDLARGQTADLKFERDLSTDLFKTNIEALGAIKIQASVLQSIFKRNEIL